jgi:hypothetical protein
MAMALTGVLLTIVAAQFKESATVSLRISRTLEHSRNARELIDTLSADVRGAQLMRLFPSYSDRSREARDGESGNYLVLQYVDAQGAITRTIGYYATARQGGGTWSVYRHDSNAGDSAPATLPAPDREGTHRRIKRAARLPDSNQLFRCVRDRGVSVRGEFGAIDGGGSDRTEFIECTISTRS